MIEPDVPAPRRPATTVITAGRGHSRTSLAPALWATSTWESNGLDDANKRATTASLNFCP